MSTSDVSVLWRIFRNPIAVRELRVAGRSVRLWIVYMIAMLIHAIVVMVVASGYTSGGVVLPDEAASIGEVLFFAEIVVVGLTTLAVVPAFSFRALVSEKESGSFDLLVLSNLQPWELVLGKFISAFLQSLLFLMAGMPFFALSYLFGGVPLALLSYTIGGMILATTGLCAVCLYFSTITNRPLAALVLCYGTALAIGMVGAMVVAGVAVSVLTGAIPDPFEIFMSAPFEARVFSLIGGLVLLGGLLSFAFVASTSRVKTEAQNRWTALRVFQTIAIVFSVGVIFLGIPMLQLPVAQDRLHSLNRVMVAASLVLMVPVLFSMLKPIADTAFPARNILRRYQAKVKDANPIVRFGRWLYLPGATSSLALSGLLLIFMLISSITAIRVVYDSYQVSESTTPLEMQIDSWRRGPMTWIHPQDTLPIVNAEEAVLVDWELAGAGATEIHSTSRTSVESEASSLRAKAAVIAPDPSTFSAIKRDMMMAQTHTFVYIALVLLLAYCCFGLFMWALSFTNLPRRAIPLLVLGILVAMIALPGVFNVISAAVPEMAGLARNLQSISPINLFRACVSMGFTDVLQEISLTQRSMDAIHDAQSSIRWDIMRGCFPFIIFGLLGLMIGIPRRKAAIAAKAQAHDRWPVPKLPPPRTIQPRRFIDQSEAAQAQAQAQTHAMQTPGEVVADQPPATDGPPKEGGAKG